MKDGFKWTGAKGAKGYQVSSFMLTMHVTIQKCYAQVGKKSSKQSNPEQTP